jgi:hypothetical protein
MAPGQYGTACGALCKSAALYMGEGRTASTAPMYMHVALGLGRAVTERARRCEAAAARSAPSRRSRAIPAASRESRSMWLLFAGNV